MIAHWLNTELWAPMWPNIFSPNVWTLIAVACHLVATLAHQRRQNQDLKQHFTKATGGADGDR